MRKREKRTKTENINGEQDQKSRINNRNKTENRLHTPEMKKLKTGNMNREQVQTTGTKNME